MFSSTSFDDCSFLYLNTYFNNNSIKLDAHSMRPVHFLSACVWFCDIMFFSDASGMVCVRAKVSESSESDASI